MSSEASAVKVFASICAIICLSVAGFQIALTFGAPLGQYSWGGKYEGSLPRNMRFASAASAILLIFLFVFYGGIAGSYYSFGNQQGQIVALWILLFLFLGSLAGNLASKNSFERKFFGPIVALVVISNIFLLIFVPKLPPY